MDDPKTCKHTEETRLESSGFRYRVCKRCGRTREVFSWLNVVEIVLFQVIALGWIYLIVRWIIEGL